MRFQLTIQPLDKQPVMPINYQYPFSAWVYKTIANADAEFATWLHEQGYTDGLKTFKLITFSRLMVKQPVPKPNERLAFAPKPFPVELGFYLDEIFRPFLTGLFANSKGQIVDRLGGIDFQILEVQRLAQPAIMPQMLLDTISPVHVSLDKGGNTPEHLSPYDPEYESLLFANLVHKYKAGNPNSTLEFDRHAFRFELASPTRERVITIKDFTAQKSKNKAFDYKCRLTAPAELMQVALDAGLGKSNTLGFGMVRAL